MISLFLSRTSCAGQYVCLSNGLPMCCGRRRHPQLSTTAFACRLLWRIFDEMLSNSTSSCSVMTFFLRPGERTFQLPFTAVWWSAQSACMPSWCPQCILCARQPSCTGIKLLKKLATLSRYYYTRVNLVNPHSDHLWSSIVSPIILTLLCTKHFHIFCWCIFHCYYTHHGTMLTALFVASMQLSL